MLKFVKSGVAVLVLGMLVIGVAGCPKKEGPAERAGKAIDKAAEKVGEKLKDAAKELKK